MLMHPTPPKREEELTEHIEMWQDKMGRREAHGEEYKLPPVFKINALRMLMVGMTKEYFDLWGGGPGPHRRGQDLRGLVEQGQGLCEEA